MTAKKNDFKPSRAADSDYEQNQRNLKGKVIKSADDDLLIRCECGRFCDQIPERNSIILYCEQCGYETEFKYLSFKNINRSKHFQAQFINGHDSIKCFEEATGKIHSSKFPVTA